MNQSSKNVGSTGAFLIAKLSDTTALESFGEGKATHAIEWCLNALKWRVTQHSGWLVEEYTNGVFAYFFGANEAIIAAINIQTNIRQGLKEYSDDLGIRIGISFGPYKIHQADGEYSAIAHLAQTLCGCASKGQILVSPALISHASKGWQEKSHTVSLKHSDKSDPAAFEISLEGLIG